MRHVSDHIEAYFHAYSKIPHITQMSQSRADLLYANGSKSQGRRRFAVMMGTIQRVLKMWPMCLVHSRFMPQPSNAVSRRRQCVLTIGQTPKALWTKTSL